MKYEKQVEKDHYSDKKYLNIGRWSSYWHQINEITSLDVNSILEIGPGNNIVSSVLRELGYSVKTLDIDDKIKPDYVDDILKPTKVEPESFDLVLASQILEHLKYEDALLALSNLARISRKYLVVSLPVYDRFNLKFSFDFMGFKIKRAFNFNLFLSPPEHQFRGQHYWVIGKKRYPLSKLQSDIKKQGLKIKKEFRPFEKNNHYFFVLEKS